MDSRTSVSTRNTFTIMEDSQTLSPQAYDVHYPGKVTKIGHAELLPGGVTKNLSAAQHHIHNESYNIRPTVREPWIDDRGNVVWSPTRLKVGKVMKDKRVEQALALIIVFNVGLIIFETNEEAKCYPEFRHEISNCPTAASNWISLSLLNNSLLMLYTLEAALNIYALRLEYFRNVMCLFDLGICLGGWLSLFMGSIIKVSWLRILRCGRILKALHFVTSIPELYMLFTGFVGSMKAMFFGALILIGLLCFFSILTVQLIHPVCSHLDFGGCDRCPRGFANIQSSMLTLFQQIVAGDSWGEISIPVILESKVGYLLPFIQLVIGVGAMNLILAVVVDRAVEAREANREQLVMIRAEEGKTRKLELLDLVRQMDANKNGMIDHEELLNAAQHSNEFVNRLRLVGVNQAELKIIVEAIEQEDTGEFGYLDFCNALDDVEASDIRKTVVLVKMNLCSVKKILQERLDKQDRALEKIHKQIGLLLQEQIGKVGTKEIYGVGSTNSHNRNADCQRNDTNRGRAASCESGFSLFSSGEFKSNASEKVSHSSQSPPSPHTPHRCTSHPSFTEEMLSCEAKVVGETARLRQTLLELDTCWMNALQIAQKASSRCVDTKLSNEVKLEHEKKHILYGHLAEQFCEIHRDIHSRQTRSFEGFIRDFEEHMASLVRHCTLCANVGTAGDIPSVETSLPVLSNDVNSPKLPSPKAEGSHLTRI